MKFVKMGDKHWEAADGEVVIDYCSNASPPWRLRDYRGVSKATPKPLSEAMSFHRTSAAAKAQATAATWHLEVKA